MRLLTHNEDDTLVIKHFDDEPVPPYAILSHTWGEENEEVTYADISNGVGQGKAGYEKIRFCGEQARHDGLQYFWIDTCCIDKSNKCELASSIRSMFMWYRNATRCYVYLSDIISPTSAINSDLPQHYETPPDRQSHQLEFSKSRWFTRYWTLQELLAPSEVYFFTKQGNELGDKLSLISDLSRITGIPKPALQGAPLSHFTIQQRIAWGEHRKATEPLDSVYALMGILGVSVSPIDGESPAEAMRRVEREVDRQNKCIQDLQSTNPYDDKTRIEATKGGLLSDSYRWIIDNSTFQKWQQDLSTRLLWIKGDPGKGKTMLMCGILNEVQKTTRHNNTVAYFFCQATDMRINNAVAVLRGLLYMLVIHNPFLTSHIRKRYDQDGKKLFEDVNAWVALSQIFVDMVCDKNLNTAYLFVDALDECITDLHKLLDLIILTTAKSTHVMWLVTSRNESHIEQRLKSVSDEARLSLELKQNARQITQAVEGYIDHKLSSLETLEEGSIRDQIRDEMRTKANGTFLWVALMIQELEKHDCFDPLAVVKTTPAGLDPFYDRMLAQIEQQKGSADVLRILLCTVTAAYRPLYLAEAGSLCALPGTTKMHRKIIASCGSFLTIRGEQIYLVHQSAKDYLNHKMENNFLPSPTTIHYQIFTQSIRLLSSTLKRDIYALEQPGISIDEVETPSPDPLANIRYSCVYWVFHLRDSELGFAGHPNVHHTATLIEEFLRKNVLYWFETLSLCRSLDLSRSKTKCLLSVVERFGPTNYLCWLVMDACRFERMLGGIMGKYPLQTYVSLLLFSPRGSLITKLFPHEKPRNIVIQPSMNKLRAEIPKRGANSVVFSPDSTKLVSMSEDKTATIWDTQSGLCLHTLRGHDNTIHAVAFSPDMKRLVSMSGDKTVKIWDIHSGFCLKTLTGHTRPVNSVAFSSLARLVSGSRDKTVKIWDTNTGACVRTLIGHTCIVNSVVFSPESTKIASASWDKTVNVWDAHTGACLQTLVGHRHVASLVTFSPSSMKLASASWDKTVKIWDAHSGARLETLEGNSRVKSLAFLPDELSIQINGSKFCLNNSVDFTTRNANFEHAYNARGYVGLNPGWITHNGVNFALIPEEFRPIRSVVKHNKIRICSKYGRVWVCTVGHT
ncbi:hypothetical protein COCC4DRAFT_184065 [Bipolaris maydis ATCC 48331]|uniref:NACHT domain-containing protein n=1 Tax=Cochliobolus heterostrophus (strain C4 / ATCC 48331 / race T) TaxID=665024 RepID=N4XGI3_COCH4|nr:uncharacterized protein COCC4DRAFT_184065 [Bipolaris maydis ATCC 48331]ENI10865.1 hypothetical protein COCC4DRAFT_184065 [Bipolaris maydis ATCC 48331]